MYPVLIEFGGVAITAFGLMMALAFWTAGHVASLELRRYGEDPEIAWDLVLWRFRLLDHRPGAVFALYLPLAGLERFIVELFRAKDDRFFGFLSLAQVISLFLVLLGMVALSKLRPRTPAIVPI
jgi:prolipoprotein diacylglyceryltransferase